MLVALHEALSAICEEGLEECWKRHKKCGQLFWEGCQSLGLHILVPKIENRFYPVSVISLPHNIGIRDLHAYLLKT